MIFADCRQKLREGLLTALVGTHLGYGEVLQHGLHAGHLQVGVGVGVQVVRQRVADLKQKLSVVIYI